MSSLPRPSFFAYLDLVCCSMGAGMLMFIIAVSATPAEKSKARESRLVAIRCIHIAGPKLEVGIEMLPPHSKEWIRPIGSDQVSFVAPSDSKSGAEACVILLSPAEGIWEFRPYLVVDNPKGDEVRVRLESFGQPVMVENKSESKLKQTGSDPNGGSLIVRVQ
jgi:hypothetical protein